MRTLPTLSFATGALALVLVACGPLVDGEAPGAADLGLAGDQSVGPLPADADLATPPGASIQFGADWNEYLSQPLYAGAELMITVHPSRFGQCGTAGRVHAGLGYPDGSVEELLLDQGWPGYDRYAMTTLHAGAERVEIWLWADNDDGCLEWDSNFGHNYVFTPHAWEPVRVRFGADWSEQVEGQLKAGGVLVIDYDWQRLPDCRVIYRGFPSWEILVHLRWDDGSYTPAQSVTRHGDMYSCSIDPVLAVFAIPEGARQVELWFENTQYPPTCRTWDSNYGRNYTFDIAAE